MIYGIYDILAGNARANQSVVTAEYYDTPCVDDCDDEQVGEATDDECDRGREARMEENEDD